MVNLKCTTKWAKATPDGWAVNKDGVPSTDAAEVLGNISRHEGGGILPLGGATEVLGGHKGYGNGMIAELFSSILSQGGTSNKCMVGGKSNICHGFMAINPEFFGDPAEIKNTSPNSYKNYVKLLKHKVKTVSTLMAKKNMNLLLKLKLKASLYLTVQCLKFKTFAMN